MNKFWKNFKRFWVWFFRWPSWFEIGLAVIMLLAVIHLAMEPLGDFFVILGCVFAFLVLSGLWLIRAVYRLFLRLPVMVRKFGRPYAGTQPVKKAIFRWVSWPVIMVLVLLVCWQHRPIQRAGFEMWKSKFEAIAKSEDLRRYSHSWIGWYQIREVTRNSDTQAVRFDSAGGFVNFGGFIYSPNSRPTGIYEDADNPELKTWPMGDGWYVWHEVF